MKKISWIALLACGFLFSHCGVKGDPAAPETPVNIGRGRPEYKSLTEDVKFPATPQIYKDQSEKKEGRQDE